MENSIINQLEAALGETVQLLSSLSQEELNAVPFLESWTAAQVGQHLFLSENGMDELLLTPTENVNRKPDEKAGELKDLFLDFGTKMKSPDFIDPEDKTYKKEELIKSLQEVKDKMLKAAKQANLEEIAPLPEGHPFKGYTKLEIVHFITYHTIRHNRQIENIIGFNNK